MHLTATPPQSSWRSSKPALPWIGVAPGAPYFVTEQGQPWHPIGQNDAISWVELNPLFRRRDVAKVEAHLRHLADHGVTVLRLMLEYAQVRHRYIEKPVGSFSPNLVQFWDDLFGLCERLGLRILLTPVDTFWMWLHFRHHPYNRKNGGPLDHPSQALLCAETRIAIKRRLSFATARWGGSGALFAWDLWNEIHPAQAQDSAHPFAEFIQDLSDHLRAEELRLHGRAHPQTVSLFGPELRWRSHMSMEEPIFRHPALDFATLHIYEQGTIDDPKNTVDAALGMGRIVREALGEIRDGRPFFDSEHGPIHSYKDHHRTLPEPFDDEYFRHMQWAHLASGGAGGGMRWPNRKPHTLTRGMRAAQKAMAGFLPLIDWPRFDRRNVSEEITLYNESDASVPDAQLARFACANANQAVVYLLRRDTLDRGGMVRMDAPPLGLSLEVPGLVPGRYRVTAWCTRTGTALHTSLWDHIVGAKLPLPHFGADLAIAISTAAQRENPASME